MRPPEEVLNTNHFGSVSDSLGRLAAVSECMASVCCLTIIMLYNFRVITMSLYRLFITKDPVMYIPCFIFTSIYNYCCVYDVSGNVTLIWKIKLECPLLEEFVQFSKLCFILVYWL